MVFRNYLQTGIIVILTLLLSSTKVLAGFQPTVVIVNQVRGPECCDTGSVAVLTRQLDEVRKLELPSTFALRFDALSDKGMTDPFVQRSSPMIETALLLEVTPSLATAASVPYSGNTDHWYKAKYAFLVGYTQEERKKLIDTAMEKYKSVFGRYPSSTVGWMIDTWSLGYLYTHYNITAHEITREQFSLDSYTLYGGPVHHPYMPSASFALIPSSVATRMPLIFRQTVTDPISTYGDTTSTYTSQANDYLAGKRSLPYFSSLLESALFSAKPYGFALIGLETSMHADAQEEYSRQLEQVAAWKKENRVQVQTMQQFSAALRQSSVLYEPTLSTRKVEDRTATWITTSHYRLRLIGQGTHIRLTDLRVYDPIFQDPYLEHPTVLSNAYWVVPWLIDGSREFKRKEGVSPKTILQLSNDFDSVPVGLTLPEATAPTSIALKSEQPFTLSYPVSNGTVTLRFLEREWIITLPTIAQAQELTAQMAALDTKPSLSFGQVQRARDVVVSPYMKEKQASLSAALPTEVLPVNASTSADVAKSILQYNNTMAIVGRNPIRLVLRLRDSEQTPVVLGLSSIQATSDGSDISVHVSPSDETDGQYFIDVHSPTPQVFNINVSLGHTGWTTQHLRFVTDCAATRKVCVKHPTQLFWYLYTKLSDRLRKQ